MKKRGKKYKNALSLITPGKEYTKEEAIELIKKMNITSFDPSIEITLNLKKDGKKKAEPIRGAFVLPHGTGNSKRVLVIAKDKKDQETALKAGAEYAGDIDMIEKIEKENFFDYDVIIATPNMMPAIGKIGKLLGPKGLMPNPKVGTVTEDVETAVTEVKGGKVTYRSDSGNVIHGIIGKKSFDEQALLENLNTYINEIAKAKPANVKGEFIQKVTISQAMGPSITVK